MSTSEAPPIPATETRVTRPPLPPVARMFYPFATVLLFVVMFWGFHRFYLHGQAYPGRPLTPPIKTLVIIHGVSMTLWMVLLVAQPILIAAKNRKLHMTLGKIGAGLAAIIVICGVAIGIGAARVNPPDLKIDGMLPKPFLTVPLFSILFFGAFVAVGVYFRKRPEIHRAMMLIATLSAIPAAVDRIDTITRLYPTPVVSPLFTVFGPFTGGLMIGGILVVLRCAITRSFDKWLVGAFGALVVLDAVTIQISKTAAWDAIATALTGK
ncbi:MAG: hypothetical protein K1X53_01255 [Candidatus Sumerlaeaceae bacterium]|nr:hypothetical protein [Candidatus Sumerlaeaceae bacterium]